MAEITKLPELVAQEQKDYLINFLTQNGLDTDELNNFKEVAVLMTMTDEDFETLYPIFLEKYEEQSLLPENLWKTSIAYMESGLELSNLETFLDAVGKQLDETAPKHFSKTKIDFLKRFLGLTVNSILKAFSVKLLQIPIAKIHPDAKLPTYANFGDAGMDLYALDDYTVHPSETKLIPTGLKVVIPAGYELQVRPKSGRALKTKFRVANTPGTIDSGYRGEICVIIDNIEPPIKNIETEPVWENDKIDHLKVTSIEYGSDFTIGKGEKFAQLVLNEVPKAAFYEVESVEGFEGDGRKEGGFGSTGVR